MIRPMGIWGNKDPDEAKFYTIDWTADLQGDTIVSPVDWTILQGSITKTQETFNTTVTQLKLGGGVDGETCLINCHFTSGNGQIFDGTMRLDIRSR